MRYLLSLLLLCLWTTLAHAQTMSVATSQVTITPNSAAYSANQCLGGILTFPNLTRVQGPGGSLIVGITFVDPQHQTAANDAINFVIFNALPTGTYTDHANCNINAADASHVVGYVQTLSTGCISDQAPNTTVCSAALAVPYTPAALPTGSTSVWVVPIVTATPTYGAAASLYVSLMATPYSGN